MADRIAVPKSSTLYVGGAFPRSESGRSYPVLDTDGGFLAHAAQASRHDAREAVDAARGAFDRWAAVLPPQRGQMLYRVAETLEGRREEFTAEVAAAEGLATKRAAALVETAIDRWVWYAGWTDKFSTVLGTVNTTSGPGTCFTVVEPIGTIAVLAPQNSSLLGLVSVLAPVLAGGNTAVVVASQNRPLPAVTLAEVLATSGIPGGVVNILTGRTAELAPWLAAHSEVGGMDLCGAPPVIRGDLEATAAGTLKRMHLAVATEPDWTRAPGLARLRAFVEPKTVWQPHGPGRPRR